MSDIQDRVKTWQAALATYLEAEIKPDNFSLAERFQLRDALNNAAYAVIGKDHSTTAYSAVSNLSDELTAANERADALEAQLKTERAVAIDLVERENDKSIAAVLRADDLRRALRKVLAYPYMAWFKGAMCVICGAEPVDDKMTHKDHCPAAIAEKALAALDASK